MTDEETLQAVRDHISATGYFAFKKGDTFYLYRQAHPKNTFVLKARDGANFKRLAIKAVVK